MRFRFFCRFCLLPLLIQIVTLTAGTVWLASSARAEEKVLYSWDFDVPGDLEGWRLGSGVQNLEVKDGALRGVYVSRDPILFLPPIEFDVRPGFVVEVRMKADFDTNGELYFSNTKEGLYGGFSSAKMKTWPICGDGEFHTVRFMPGWLKEGKIIQLRLDPGTGKESLFGKSGFAIDSVKIIDLNYDSIPFSKPVWDFANDSEAAAEVWSAPGSNVKKSAKGWKITLDSENREGVKTPSMKAGPMRLENGEYLCWCSVEMAVTKGVVARLRLSNDSVTVPLEIPVAVCPDGKMRVHNLLISNSALNPRDIFYAELELSDAEDAEVVVRSIRFGSEPQGPAQLLLQEGGGLTNAFNRAGRALPFEFSIMNSGGRTVESLKIDEIELPSGVSVVGELSNALSTKELEPFVSAKCKLDLIAEKATAGKVVVKISGKNESVNDKKGKKLTETYEFPIEILPSLNLPKADYVPEPRPLKSEYEIGALYFPGWGKPEAWERIFPVAPIRKPVLGWYDEANPECIDWQIKWAVENGIQYFLVDWYWSRGSRHLEHWVNGFQKARYRSYLKWAMMWANHNGPGSHSEEDQAAVTKFWIENYFNTPEYYRIDDRPVVMIWSPEGMDRDVRDIYRAKGIELKKGEGVKKLLDLSQKMAKDAGLKGIYFIAMKWPEASTEPGCVQWLADAGFEMTSIYHYMHHGGVAPNQKYFSFDYCVDSIEPYWEARQETGILPFLPNLSTGWDSRPWHGLRQTVIYDRTPEKFRKICEKCLEFTKKSGQRNIILAPLNEWGEGSYAEPNKEFGFGMFEAVRETFCEKPAEGWPLNYAPEDVGLGPYDFSFRKSDVNAVINCAFDAPISDENPRVWSDLMGVSKPEIRDGNLIFTTTTRDPAIQARPENLTASRYSRLVVRMRISYLDGKPDHGDAAQLFWGTIFAPISENSSLRAPLVQDGEFHEYVFPLATSKFWKGKVDALRLDPCSTKNVRVEIDFIRFEK